ncbi:MAG: HupE/UreJ family protein [Gemmatimonadota bacterium]|nr:HupE/UreJ family protein [Gemmatimonadota bacterium]
MRGRRQRSGAMVALAAAAWVPVGPAEGAGFAAAPAPERHSPVVAAPVPLPHARPAAAPAPLPHEIPADVIVRAFVKAEGGALRLVLRVPLTSMRDVDFPVRGPGYVEIDEASLLLDDLATLWIAGYVTLYEEAARLPTPLVTATRISLPSDPSFADYDHAVAHMSAPQVSPGVDLVLEQAMLDVVLETPIRSADSRFSIDPAWAHLGIRTTTVLRFVTPEGAERVFQYTGSPGQVRLDPRWHQALLRFVALGFAHILDGIDHLLFLLCLVVPLRRLWPLVSVVTAFTVAHSITLGASVLGIAPNALWFPPLIEMLIAASIVFMALENIVGRTLERRWLWAFGFGLVHGFGFSFQLRESLQFAGSHLYTSLLGFNVGVELGQLFALLFMVPALALLFAKVVAPRIGGIVVSALVAHTSWHWMTERWGVFSAYDFQRPIVDAVFGAAMLRWVLLLLIVVGTAWGMAEGYRRLAKRFGNASGGDAGAEGMEAGDG